MPVPLLTREELLHRLTETFCRYGYDGASMTRIAEATGLGKASLYHYFPNGKEQMGAAVVSATAAWFEEPVFHPLEGVHPPRQRLASMLTVLDDLYQSGNRACLPGLFALTEERTMFGPAIQEFFQRWLTCLTQVCADAGLGRDIAQRRASEGLQRIQGAVVFARALNDRQAFAALARELPDHLLAGGDRSTVWTTRSPKLPFAPSHHHGISQGGTAAHLR